MGELVGLLTNLALHLLRVAILDFLVEVLFRGAGFFISRTFSKRVNRDDPITLIVGAVFWAAFVILGFYAYSHMETS
jgi:hypothetical protein